ncbi:hypothetical protein EDB85DRAFT_457573 [Lactarius pseudohatsudake]|nr:hypothetical protein EDB85DRAFT_457573 [Lactarius pseudohatsudake]
MGDKLDSIVPLKPDILKIRTPRQPKIFWNDVAISVEVNAHPVDVVKQLATYARAHLALNRRRSFSIAIAFDHRILTFRFLCFHRSGVSASPLLELAKEDGFRSIVDHMVGILSIRDEAAFGLDMTCTENVYRLNGHNYEIVRTIQNRDSVRGHSTAVFGLKLETTGARDTSALLQSRELTLIDGISQLPEKLVYKLSYQTEGRRSEGTLFSPFFGPIWNY